MGNSVFDEFPKPDYESSGPINNIKNPRQNPYGIKQGQDAVCNGTGYLWEDAYGNRVKCWRCLGSGVLPNLVQIKQNQVIPETDDGIDGIGPEFGPNDNVNEGNQLDEVQNDNG